MHDSVIRTYLEGQTLISWNKRHLLSRLELVFLQFVGDDIVDEVVCVG